MATSLRLPLCVQLTQELFDNNSYLEELEINGMFTYQFYDLNLESNLCSSAQSDNTDSLAGLSE